MLCVHVPTRQVAVWRMRPLLGPVSSGARTLSPKFCWQEPSVERNTGPSVAQHRTGCRTEYRNECKNAELSRPNKLIVSNDSFEINTKLNFGVQSEISARCRNFVRLLWIRRTDWPKLQHKRLIVSNIWFCSFLRFFCWSSVWTFLKPEVYLNLRSVPFFTASEALCRVLASEEQYRVRILSLLQLENFKSSNGQPGSQIVWDKFFWLKRNRNLWNRMNRIADRADRIQIGNRKLGVVLCCS